MKPISRQGRRQGQGSVPEGCGLRSALGAPPLCREASPGPCWAPLCSPKPHSGRLLLAPGSTARKSAPAPRRLSPSSLPLCPGTPSTARYSRPCTASRPSPCTATSPRPSASRCACRACACVCGHACVCLGWGIHFQVCLRVCVCVCAHVRAVCLLPAVPAHVGGRVHVAGPGRLPLATPSPLLDTQQHVLSLPTALYPRTPRGAQWVTGLHPQGAGKKHSHKARSRW